jgi:hypothetical protein
VSELYDEARAYLTSHRWCAGIRQGFVGIAVGGVVGVFLFHIDPAKTEVEEWLWIVVGDVPPAYLVVDQAGNPARALDAYISEMTVWVHAVREGESVDEVIPVLTRDGGAVVEETAENAEMLAGRLEFLEERILSDYRDDLSL